MKTEINDLLLVKYLTGEATRDEKAVVEHWLALSEENEKEFNSIKEYWDSGVAFDTGINRGYSLMTKKINRHKGLGRGLAVILSLAASMVIGVILGTVFLPAGSRATVTKYVTESGISTFLLPDNTEVTLNKNSSLSFDSDFGKKDRKVELKGECYFKVVYDNERKFKVYLDGAEVTVLGTEFNARNRPEENQVSVSLVSGSVLFNAGTQSVRLMPGHKIVYERGVETVCVEPFDSDITTAWKDNIFRYKSMQLSTLLKSLAKDKGVEVYIEGGLAEKNDLMSGSLDMTQSFGQMLIILSHQSSFKWTMEKGNYYIYE